MILVLFFTRSVSLKIWIKTGLFDREKLLYEEHLRRGHFQKVFWLTYGHNDECIAAQLKADGRLHPDIDVIAMPRVLNTKVGKPLYSFLMPLLQRDALRQADVFKTNQMDGSWSAVLSRLLFRKPLIVRTGYTLSIFAEKMQRSRFRIFIYRSMEWLAYKAATRAMVASKQDHNFIISRYGYPSRKTVVLPNYIDLNLFKPFYHRKHKNRIVFIGRLNRQKNIFNLISAIAKTHFILDIYGQGELHDALERHAQEQGAQVNFLGTVPNSEMPQILNKYKYYILPSLFEGMPKTLLEAMACGCICIGTDVDGINEVITDGVNGFLAAGIDAEAVHAAIGRAAHGNNDSIAIRAVETIRARFSLQSIVKSEKRVCLQVSGTL